MIKSVYNNQEDILDAIEKLHCPDGFEADLTYGNGMFYKNRKEPVFKFDIDPQKPDVIRSCSTDLFLPDNSLSLIAFLTHHSLLTSKTVVTIILSWRIASVVIGHTVNLKPTIERQSRRPIVC